MTTCPMCRLANPGISAPTGVVHKRATCAQSAEATCSAPGKYRRPALPPSASLALLVPWPSLRVTGGGHPMPAKAYGQPGYRDLGLVSRSSGRTGSGLALRSSLVLGLCCSRCFSGCLMKIAVTALGHRCCFTGSGFRVACNVVPVCFPGKPH